jgi:hypothetical protein
MSDPGPSQGRATAREEAGRRDATAPRGPLAVAEWMLRLDRRWLFVFVAVAVSLPLFLNLQQRVAVTPEARGIHDALAHLPPRARVLLACDYDPGSAAELQPMTVTFLKQALSRRLRVIVMGLWPQGPPQADLALQEALRDPAVAALSPRYGEDYINLGFQSGNEVVIQRMGSSIPAVFPRDYRGTPIGQFPIMEGVRNFGSLAYVFNVSAGYPGTVEWVQFAADRFHAALGSGTTAVSAPLYYTYYPAQLTGLLGGMKGAAEYEAVSGFTGKAVTYMFSQSLSHIVIVLFILLGNLAFALTLRRGARR